MLRKLSLLGFATLHNDLIGKFAMHPVRQFVSLLCALALTSAGLFILYQQFFHSDVLKGIILLGAGSMASVGLLWLWADFIAPILQSPSKKP